MGKQLIALAVSDIHFHDWKQFNENGDRTQVTIDILAELFCRSDEEDIPILFSGDLFHTPKGLTTKTLTKFTTTMDLVRSNFRNSLMIGITGNHDGSTGSSLWEAMCKAFPKQLVNIDNNFVHLKNKAKVYGLPYRRRNVDLVNLIKIISKKPGKKILLLHTELYGAPDPSGYEAIPQNFSRESLALFKDFDLVLAGHVHKHTQVMDNVYMVGAPNQQRKSDAGTSMGYLEIYDDYSVEFIPIKSPGFRTFNEGQEHEDTDDYWVKIPKPKKLKKQSEAEFSPNMDKTEMAKRYVKEIGVKNPKRVRALINILNDAEEN